MTKSHQNRFRANRRGEPLAKAALSLFAAIGILSPALANSYSTRFPRAENPLSESGHWIDGKAVGIDWGDVSSTPGRVVGQSGPARYADATALLTGKWRPDQSAEATVWAGATHGNPEAELRLRSSLSAHRATGYEISERVASDDSGYLIIVRWNGPLADFTYLANLHGRKYGVKAGDVMKATVVGNVITAYKNGVMLAQAKDDAFAAGNPGMGFNEGENGDYGYVRFSASDLPNRARTPKGEKDARRHGALAVRRDERLARGTRRDAPLRR